jgi:murein DD-endopeptidase MepM/ murein hydrolase activator NlpD
MRWSATLLLLLLGGTTPAVAAPDPVGEWPLSPVPGVVAGFDPPASTWGAGHRGVDLLGRLGQPVRAAMAGRVSFVGSIAGRGVVTVDHGPTRTTYQPVEAAVPRGTRVGAGEVVGTLALPGSHCFPRTCLHWGWLRGDTYLDPLGLVGAGPVRLLPLDGLLDTPGSAVAPGRPPPTPYAGWQPLETLAEAWVEGAEPRPSRALAAQHPPLLRLLRPGVQP